VRHGGDARRRAESRKRKAAAQRRRRSSSDSSCDEAGGSRQSAAVRAQKLTATPFAAAAAAAADDEDGSNVCHGSPCSGTDAGIARKRGMSDPHLIAAAQPEQCDCGNPLLTISSPASGAAAAAAAAPVLIPGLPCVMPTEDLQAAATSLGEPDAATAVKHEQQQQQQQERSLCGMPGYAPPSTCTPPPPLPDASSGLPGAWSCSFDSTGTCADLAGAGGAAAWPARAMVPTSTTPPVQQHPWSHSTNASPTLQAPDEARARGAGLVAASALQQQAPPIAPLVAPQPSISLEALAEHEEILRHAVQRDSKLREQLTSRLLLLQRRQQRQAELQLLVQEQRLQQLQHQQLLAQQAQLRELQIQLQLQKQQMAQQLEQQQLDHSVFFAAAHHFESRLDNDDEPQLLPETAAPPGLDRDEFACPIMQHACAHAAHACAHAEPLPSAWELHAGVHGGACTPDAAAAAVDTEVEDALAVVCNPMHGEDDTMLFEWVV